MRTRAFVLFAMTFITAAPIGAQPRSANCSQARSEAERAICGTPALRTLDQQLGAAYRTAVARMGSADGKQQLLATQKAWLVDRDRCGNSTACLRDDMTRRIAWLSSPLMGYAGVYTNDAFTVLVTVSNQSLAPIVRLYRGNRVSEPGLLLMESEARWVKADDPLSGGEEGVVFRPIFLGVGRARPNCSTLKLTFFQDDLMSVQAAGNDARSTCPWFQAAGKGVDQADFRYVRAVYDYTPPVR